MVLRGSLTSAMARSSGTRLGISKLYGVDITTPPQGANRPPVPCRLKVLASPWPNLTRALASGTGCSNDFVPRLTEGLGRIVESTPHSKGTWILRKCTTVDSRAETGLPFKGLHVVPQPLLIVKDLLRCGNVLTRTAAPPLLSVKCWMATAGDAAASLKPLES
jgi:hypothetical protein